MYTTKRYYIFILTFISLFLSLNLNSALAALKLNISIVYMKGVSQELVLTSELHVSEITTDGGEVLVEMSNGLNYRFRPKFVDTIYETGPSSILQIQGEIVGQGGQFIRPLIDSDEDGNPLRPPVYTVLGGQKNFTFDDKQGGQRVEISVRPVMMRD